MRIAIDGMNLAMANGTGVATYGAELVAALHAGGHAVDGIFGVPVPGAPALRETAFFEAVLRRTDVDRKLRRRRRRWRYLRPFGAVRPRAVPLTGQVERGAFEGRVPAFDRVFSAPHLFDDAFASFRATGRFLTVVPPDGVDVMHWTYPVPLVARGIPNIYTIHDLVPLKLPYATLDNKVVHARLIERCIAVAAQICTVSQASANDIVERFGIDRARITNTYQSATMSLAALSDDPVADAHAIEGIFGFPRRGYFLYFGAIEPKKNIGRLIEAYLTLQTDTPLVVVGARMWQSESELRLIPGGGASGAAGTYRGERGQVIVRLDYLSGSLLAKLIRGAKAVVFPSLYEGFGLPVLEAMQLGTPVIASTTASLPEVAGDAGLLVDPFDVDALAAAMRRLDGDEALGQAMGARGLEQARLFSQECYRERLTQLYQAAMAG